MQNSLKPWQRVVMMVGCACGLLSFVMMSPTFADSSGQPTFHGRTYGEWSVRWWRWLWSIPDLPEKPNPLKSSGTVDCTIGQSGPVIFLAGTTGEGPVKRSCTVPADKALFFSPLNYIYHNDPTDPPPPLTAAEKRELLDSILSDSIPGPFNSRPCHLTVTVNGVPIALSGVAMARTQSPAFRIKIGEHNVAGWTAGAVDKEAVSDGFWVMLQLPKGKHTLHVQGEECDFDTHEPLSGRQDYTYRLRVE
jgi:hypothetical protein